MRGFALVLMLVLTACGGAQRDGGGAGMVARNIGRVSGPGGCGIGSALEVSGVAGVWLTPPATLSRDEAQKLNAWVRDRAIPLVGRRGGGLSELTVAASYACRTRNSRPGARLSEHAKGNAIDISGFVLRDGSRVTVKEGWGRGADGELLARLRRSACGPFGTVLGPGSDGHHLDHFQLDAARYRSGPYCR